MDKLPMCRLCLAENVRMYIVVDRNLRELYERLTDIPFVTKDSRPILACFVCCTQLKKCYKLLKKCLKAEELFTRMMNEDYELKPLINQDQFELFHGFIKTPIESMSIVDVGPTESIVVKEELPAVCEGLNYLIEPQEDDIDNGLKPVNKHNNYPDIEDIPLNHFESQTDDDLPLMNINTRVEEQQNISKNRRAEKTNNQETVNYRFTGTNNHWDIEVAPRLSASDSEDDDLPVMQVKTQSEKKQEVSEKKLRADGSNSAPVAKKPKLGTARTKLEDTITAEQKKADPEMFADNQNPLLKPLIASKPYKCEICQRSFDRKSKLTNHIRTHTGEKPFNCDICQRSFTVNSTLTRHMRTHTGEKPIKCGICHRNFRQKNNFENHMRTHTDLNRFKCDICHCTFSCKATLLGHVRTHTDEKPFKCDICQISFGHKSTLTVHMRTHTGEKPFKCEICQHSFSSRPNFGTHMRTHTGEKRFKCDNCQISFRLKSTFIVHMRTHTGEKPFKCHICHRSLSTKFTLTVHMRTHTSEKPFKCEICQISFSSNLSLTIHMRTHTGEKPIKCGICHRNFRQKNNFESHMRTHTDLNRFKCDICHCSFSCKATLLGHVRTHTDEKQKVELS